MTPAKGAYLPRGSSSAIVVTMSCVLFACASPTSLSWPDGHILNGGKNETIDNVTRFASGANTIVEGSKTALVFDICAMSNVAISNGETEIFIDIGPNATFDNNAQLWFFCKPSSPPLSSRVIAAITIRHSRFTNTAIGFANLNDAALQLRVVVSESTFVRSPNVTGILNDRPFAVLTGSPLMDIHVDVASSSRDLYDAVMFLHNISVAALGSQFILDRCSIAANWQIPSIWVARVYLSTILHTGGLRIANGAQMALSNCIIDVEGLSLIYGLFYYSSALTIIDGSTFIINATNWRVHRPAHYVHGIYHLSSPLTIKNGSQFLMQNTAWNVSGDGYNVYGVFHNDASMLVSKRSRYVMESVVWTVRGGGGQVYGFYQRASAFVVSASSQYILSNTQWHVLGMLGSVFGVFYSSNAVFQIMDGSQYIITGSRWNISGQTSVYGIYYHGSSPSTVANGSSYVLNSTSWNITATSDWAAGVYYWSSSTLTVANRSQYAMMGNDWNVEGTGGVQAVYCSSSAGVHITNGSLYLMRHTIWRVVGTKTTVYGIRHDSSPLKISNGSQYLMMETLWKIYGSVNAGTLFGISFAAPAEFEVSDGSQFMMVRTNWSLHGTGNIYGIGYFVPMSMMRGSQYGMRQCYWVYNGISPTNWFQMPGFRLGTDPRFPSYVVFSKNSFLSSTTSNFIVFPDTPFRRCNYVDGVLNHRLGFGIPNVIPCVSNISCTATDCLPSFLTLNRTTDVNANGLSDCDCSCNATAQDQYLSTVLSATVWRSMNRDDVWDNRTCWLRFVEPHVLTFREGDEHLAKHMDHDATSTLSVNVYRGSTSASRTASTTATLRRAKRQDPPVSHTAMVRSALSDTAPSNSSSMTLTLAQIIRISPRMQTKVVSVTTRVLEITEITATSTFRESTVVAPGDGTRPENGGAGVLSSVVGTVPTTATLATSTAASVVTAGIVNPSAVTQVLRAALVTGIVNCAFSANEDELEPSRMELPLQIRVPGSNDDNPTYFGLYVGSLVLNSACFIFLPCAVLLLIWRSMGTTSRPWVIKLQSKVVSTASFLGYAYFAPTSIKVLALVVFHSATAIETVLVVACVLVNAVFGVVFLRMTVVLRPHQEKTISDGDAAAFGSLFDGARLPQMLSCRLYFFEELLVTIVLMFCDGIRPRQGNCGYVAVALGVVTTLHLLYLVVRRPYECKVELACAIISALVLVGIASVAMIATLGTQSPTLIDVLGYLLFAESMVIVVQSVVLAVYTYTKGQKRKLLAYQAKIDDAAASPSPSGPDGVEAMDVPLLAIPSPQGKGCCAQEMATHNPLLADRRLVAA